MTQARLIPLAATILIFSGVADPSSSRADAGIGTHGGNVIICDGKEAVTLDFYHAMLPTGRGAPDVVDTSEFSATDSLAFIRERLSKSMLGLIYEAALKKLGDPLDWISTSLKDVSDSDEPYIPVAGCRRVTGAARQGDTMFLDPQVWKVLSNAQHGMLNGHEALYLAAGGITSQLVREWFRVALRKEPKAEELRTATLKLGNYYGHGVLAWGYDPTHGRVQKPVPVYTSRKRQCGFRFGLATRDDAVTGALSDCNEMLQDADHSSGFETGVGVFTLDWSENGRMGRIKGSKSGCVIVPDYQPVFKNLSGIEPGSASSFTLRCGETSETFSL